jgi:hypothetical protein
MQERDACVPRAGAVGLLSEVRRIALEPRRFGHEATDVIAGPFTQDVRGAVFDDRQVHAVACDEQVGRRRKRST